MIIHINQSKLFTEDPAVRFGRYYCVDEGVWRDLLLRHKVKDYTIEDVCEFFHIRVGFGISPDAIRKWITRSDIYAKALPAIKKGATTVNSNYFDNLEKEVLYEITRHMRFGEAKDSRNII